MSETLGIALGHPVSGTDEVSQASEPAWDSMKHMEIMLMLEEAFQIAFEPDDFAEMTSLERCVQHVAARLGARASD